MGNTDVIKVLTDLLNDERQLIELRIAAADGLGYGGFSGARDALQQVVEDGQADVLLRQAAIRALGQTLHTSK
ncbi:hypothetical protein GUY40_24080 [Pseudomonas sp. R5(2019)]|nr:hypothetical protein [Pseudomonas sp. R5(2019)]